MLTYDYLKESISILLISEDLAIIKAISTFIKSIDIYRLHIITSLKESEKHLKEKRIHLCFLDSSFKNYTLIDNFPLTSFVITVNEEINYQEAFKYASIGAKYIIDIKNIDSQFLKDINNIVLSNIINPLYKKDILYDTLSISTKKLIEQKPCSSNSWASKTNISDRQLRYVWNLHLKVQTKIILFIFKLYNGLLNNLEIFKTPLIHGEMTLFYQRYKTKILQHINRSQFSSPNKM